MANKNAGCGCLALLLVLALVVTGAVYGIKALLSRDDNEPSAEKSGEVMEAGPAAAEEPSVPEIDPDLSPTIAFRLGNDAYEEGDYPLAEAYYRSAVRQDAYYTEYRNNLGLALLQQEKNEEALELFVALVEEEPYTYGYWVNLLGAAHANGIAANEVFTAQGGWEIMPQLITDAQYAPYVNSKILEALYYNAVYMDMELD
jgi:tetratricopeptide (TPR) repeat protein